MGIADYPRFFVSLFFIYFIFVYLLCFAVLSAAPSVSFKSGSLDAFTAVSSTRSLLFEKRRTISGLARRSCVCKKRSQKMPGKGVRVRSTTKPVSVQLSTGCWAAGKLRTGIPRTDCLRTCTIAPIKSRTGRSAVYLLTNELFRVASFLLLFLVEFLWPCG